MPSGRFRAVAPAGFKICTKCEGTHPVDAFSRSRATTDGLHSWCKQCLRAARSTPESIARQAQRNAAYVLTEEQRERKAARDRLRPTPVRTPERKARQAAIDSTAERKAYRAWYKTTPAYAESRRKSQNKRYLTDPNWRLQKVVGAHIRHNIIKGGRPTREYLDYGFDVLRAHLEAQFLPGMTWANYGATWEIDHIIPQSKFDLTEPLEFSLCWALDNLRPLWAHLNKAKSDTLDYVLPDNWRDTPAYV